MHAVYYIVTDLVFNSMTLSLSELSTGRMDQRVGSGRIGSRFCQILAGRVGSALQIFKFFADYFLVPESILIFEYYIRIIDFLRYLIYNN